jgi:8-oxo-dGTP pyrophosphatase MutT (NUDIX family)
MQPWERLDRKTLVDTPFLKVYSDKIRLPNGSLIDDYTVVKKRDAVMIVATDEDNKLITFKEYKYAANEMLLTLPAGQIDKDEPVQEAAKRELLEETGYTGDDFEVIDELKEYPTKDLHTITVVRARNVRLVGTVHHEETENIGDVQLQTVDELRSSIRNGEWKITATLASILVALPELFSSD